MSTEKVINAVIWYLGICMGSGELDRIKGLDEIYLARSCKLLRLGVEDSFYYSHNFCICLKVSIIKNFLNEQSSAIRI